MVEVITTNNAGTLKTNELKGLEKKKPKKPESKTSVFVEERRPMDGRQASRARLRHPLTSSQYRQNFYLFFSSFFKETLFPSLS